MVFLFVSIAFLWLTIWSYLQISQGDLASVMSRPVQDSRIKILGTAFLVTYGAFAVLSFSTLSQKGHKQKNEGAML